VETFLRYRRGDTPVYEFLVDHPSVTPEHAKRFLLALKDNIEKYESSFGAIKRTEDLPKFPMNFGGTIGEA
jgi:hypothetical protein